MVFYFPLMCCEYRDVSLLKRFHPSQWATESCYYTFAGSKYGLCVQPSVMEMYVNDKIYDPCPSSRVVMYMVTSDASNYRRFNVIFQCHDEMILHRHARPLSLYPPMSYSREYYHSVTDGLKNTMLFIGTPLVVTCRRNFIHSWIY